MEMFEYRDEMIFANEKSPIEQLGGRRPGERGFAALIAEALNKKDGDGCFGYADFFQPSWGCYSRAVERRDFVKKFRDAGIEFSYRLDPPLGIAEAEAIFGAADRVPS